MVSRSVIHRTILIAAALTLLLLPDLAPAGASTTDAHHETGTIRAIVRHNDGVTRPMPGVSDAEVFVYDIDAQTTYLGCTNASGIARFVDVPIGNSFISAAGPSYGEAPDGSNRCANGEFLNPFPGDDLGKKMFAVYWNRHKGERSFDTFAVTAGQTTLLVFGTSTPPNQRKVCAGLRVTIMGTTGDDTGATAIVGDGDPNVINALGGDDEIYAGGGKDTVCGGPGKDYIAGGEGDDILWGENGLDEIDGMEGYDTIHGGSQADACEGENLISCESGL